MNEAHGTRDRNADEDSPAAGTPLEIEITFLELTSLEALSPSPRAPEMRFERARIPSPELGRFLYTAVGGDWHWTDRLGWDREAWAARLSREDVETWVGLVGGNVAGYVELEIAPGGDAEIVYFGLLPGFTDRGLGGDLLTRAVERCFEAGATRVWLHTCTLDGPAALPNYRKRGFEVFDTRMEERSPGA